MKLEKVALLKSRAVPEAGDEQRYSSMDRRVETSGRHLRRWLFGIGMAVLLLAAGIALYVRYALIKSVAVRASSVVIKPVRQEVFTEYVPATAVVVPRTTAYLDAVEGGQVAEVLVEEGAFVSRGQLLLRLKNTNLQLEMLGRQAQLMEQLDRLNQTVLSFEQARVTHDRELIEADALMAMLTERQRRRDALRATGTVSQQEFDESAIELARARKAYAAAVEARDIDRKFHGEQVAQLRSSIKATRENLDVAGQTMQSLLVKAPIDGQLTALDADLGAAKSPGQRIGQIDDSTAFKIEAWVDEFYLGRVKQGQSATAQSNGRTWRLEVAKIYPQVTNRKFKVDLYFTAAAAPEGLHRGQSMDLRFEVGASSKELVTSNGPFLEETGGNWVFVLPPSGSVAQRRTVRFGRRNPEQVEVLSGLAEGERIISSGYDQLRKFERVEIIPE